MTKDETLSPAAEVASQGTFTMKMGEVLIERAIQTTGVSAIALVVMIFFFLIREGVPAFVQVPLRDLFSARWYPIEG